MPPRGWSCRSSAGPAGSRAPPVSGARTWLEWLPASLVPHVVPAEVGREGQWRSVATLPMPSNLVAACRGDGRAAWLAALPGEIEAIAAGWAVTLGEPYEPGGQTAWVAPAHSTTYGDVVLKVGWRHMEAEDEAAGLREWNGEGAVRVFADGRHGQTTALLLERCLPGRTLADRPEDEQDTVISTLLRRLWREPADRAAFRPLQVMCEYWADSFERKLARGVVAVEPEIAREGAQLFRSLPESAAVNLLLCTDLHAENVLASEREDWLVIDPKPFYGDPTYDALQHLLNCEDRLLADPVALATRVARLLGLDPERLLLWLYARCIVDSTSWPWTLDLARRLRCRRHLAPGSGA
jgi:streptomycin 6-kinase